MHFIYGPDQANTMGQFIEMANPAGPGANYIDTKRRQTAILAVRFAKVDSKPRHPGGNGNHYNDRNDQRPVLQAYCPGQVSKLQRQAHCGTVQGHRSKGQ